MAEQPNVIFIITHDVGPVHGAYGNSQIRSPNIDALADESIRFDSHYCQWPLCGPSRANIFTGCRPSTTRRFNNRPFFEPFRQGAPEGFVSLPEHFAMSGSISRGIGWIYHDDIDPPSWSEGHEIPAANAGPLPDWAAGWLDADYLFEWKSDNSRDLIRRRLQLVKDSGVTPAELRDQAVFRRVRGPAVEAAGVSDDAYYDGKVAASACEYLGSTVGSGSPNTAVERHPYFLGVGFVAPHMPFRAPKRYWDLYDPRALKLHPNRDWPRGSAEWMAGDSEPAQYYTTDGHTKPWRPSESQLRELLHGHYATISYADALIGRIISAAKARGDWDNTIVVVTSDHGFSEGQHGYWGKHNMWDPSLHVPLFIKPPQGVANSGWPKTVSRITEHVDIFPTLCDMAGLPTPDHCEGQSLVPLLEDPGITWKDMAISHRRHMWHDRLQVYDLCNSLRTPRHRYTEYLDPSGDLLGAELFDYQEDPMETTNLADAGRRINLKREMAERLRRAVRPMKQSRRRYT